MRARVMTCEEVKTIRENYIKGVMSLNDIKKEFDISYTTARRIVYQETYKDCPPIKSDEYMSRVYEIAELNTKRGKSI